MTYGRNDLMAVAAVRYCLGRSSYIVGDCCEWLPQVWPTLSESARNIIKRDIDDAFKADDESRADKYNQYHRLGMDIDRAEWEKVRGLWVDKP